MLKQPAQLSVVVVLHAAELDDGLKHRKRARLLGWRNHLEAERREPAQAEPQRRRARGAFGGDCHAQVKRARHVVPDRHQAQCARETDHLHFEVVCVGEDGEEAALVAAGDVGEPPPCRDPVAPRGVGFSVEERRLERINARSEDLNEGERQPVGKVRREALAEPERQLEDVRHIAARGVAPEDRREVALRRMQVNLVEVVFDVVTPRDDWLLPEDRGEREDAVCCHRHGDGGLALPRHKPVAGVVDVVDVHAVVERRDENVVDRAERAPRLTSVLNASRSAGLEGSFHRALRGADARDTPEREEKRVVVERGDVGVESGDVLDVTRGCEPRELAVDAVEASSEAQQVRADDHIKGRAGHEHDARAKHVPQLLIRKRGTERVEQRVGIEVGRKLGVEVGRRKVGAVFIKQDA